MLLQVMLAVLTAFLAAGIFAAAGYLGIELSKIVARHTPGVDSNDAEQGKRIGGTWLLVGTGLFGAVLSLRGMEWQSLSMAAILCISLAACWHSAVTKGTVSDYFTLVPLGAIILSDIVQQNWFFLLSPLIPFVLFLAPAYISKGKGMGWDDAKLAALGGAILGLEFSLLALASACVIAVFVAWARKRTTERIIFAPYMIAAIGAYLAWNVVPGT